MGKVVIEETMDSSSWPFSIEVLFFKINLIAFLKGFYLFLQEKEREQMSMRNRVGQREKQTPR